MEERRRATVALVAMEEAMVVAVEEATEAATVVAIQAATAVVLEAATVVAMATAVESATTATTSMAAMAAMAGDVAMAPMAPMAPRWRRCGEGGVASGGESEAAKGCCCLSVLGRRELLVVRKVRSNPNLAENGRTPPRDIRPELLKDK
jgi:hypothetical protein